jgi:hypothetical protein
LECSHGHGEWFPESAGKTVIVPPGGVCASRAARQDFRYSERTGVGAIGASFTKSDGRRAFPAQFKRAIVAQLLNGEKILAEVSRELDIQPRVSHHFCDL